MHQCAGVGGINFSKCTPNGPSTLARASLVLTFFFRVLRDFCMFCLISVSVLPIAVLQPKTFNFIRYHLEYKFDVYTVSFRLNRISGYNLVIIVSANIFMGP